MTNIITQEAHDKEMKELEAKLRIELESAKDREIKLERKIESLNTHLKKAREQRDSQIFLNRNLRGKKEPILISSGSITKERKYEIKRVRRVEND